MGVVESSDDLLPLIAGVCLAAARPTGRRSTCAVTWRVAVDAELNDLAQLGSRGAFDRARAARPSAYEAKPPPLGHNEKNSIRAKPLGSGSRSS